jgi:hypothetical protein
VIFIVGSSLAGCGFVEPTESDPNSVPSATLDPLFVANQANTWDVNEDFLSRVAAMWMQQVAGADRQTLGWDVYEYTDGEVNQAWEPVYGGGGLVDLREAERLAEDAGRRVYAGILKVHEAFLVGTAAAAWGDIPYAEAVDLRVSEPELDPQLEVYAALVALLDEALADLESGEGAGPGDVDFVFGGDAQAWAAVARTLQARFHMHLAEVDGDSRYDAALAAAAGGIAEPSGNWVAVRTITVGERNGWVRAQSSSRIVAGAFGVELLDLDGDSLNTPGIDDPRLPIYYTTGEVGSDFEGKYVGSPPGNPPGDPENQASRLNIPAEDDFGQVLASCSENAAIIAEAHFALGDEAAAQSALQDLVDCQEARWAALGYPIDLSTVIDPTSLSGAALRQAIAEQKYIAQFLSIDAWADWKRTCLPALTPAPGTAGIPGRLLYPYSERSSNGNIPDPGVQAAYPGPPPRNRNDPNPC